MNQWLSSLRSLNFQVWVQAIGRLFCQVGFGLISFYIPLLFVNQVGLSATSVGFSIGLSSLTEVVAHFIGGSLSDSPRFGRKTALSLSAALGIVVSLVLAVSDSLFMLAIASLLLGFSLGFYWTASSAAVMDATALEERHHAFAVMGVAEYVGVGLGVLGGGTLLLLTNQSPLVLFTGCGTIFLGFFLLIQLAMTPAQLSSSDHENLAQGILTALKDRSLIIFLLANTFYATYVALVTSTIPLYFTNVVAGSDSTPGVSVGSTANLFTWCYIGVGAVVQLPIAQLFTAFPRVRVLMVAMLLWATGFFLLWATGTFATSQFLWGILALCILSIASVTYKPFFVAIVSELAPASLRGAYTAVSSQSWTIGYFIGPIMGGWAIDQSPVVSRSFWLVVAASTLVCITLLRIFEIINPEIEPEIEVQPSEGG